MSAIIHSAADRSAPIRVGEPKLGSVVNCQEACEARHATEDIEMFARKGLFSSIGRAAVMATVAAMALSVVEPSLARAAGPAPSGKGLSAATGTSTATDFSARRRHYGGGGAAAAAAFAGIVGTGLAIAASQSRRDYYDDYYGAAPVYSEPAPVYYGGGPYYGGNPYYGGYHSGVPHYRGHPLASW
jgi:hypothetical protein